MSLSYWWTSTKQVQQNTLYLRQNCLRLLLQLFKLLLSFGFYKCWPCGQSAQPGLTIWKHVNISHAFFPFLLSKRNRPYPFYRFLRADFCILSYLASSLHWSCCFWNAFHIYHFLGARRGGSSRCSFSLLSLPHLSISISRLRPPLTPFSSVRRRWLPPWPSPARPPYAPILSLSWSLFSIQLQLRRIGLAVPNLESILTVKTQIIITTTCLVVL